MSRRPYYYNNRYRKKGFKRRSKRFKLKLFLVLFPLFIFGILLLGLIGLFMGSSVGGDEIEYMKTFDIPHFFLRKAIIAAEREDVELSRLLTYAISKTGCIQEDFNDEVLDEALKRAKKKDKLKGFEEDTYDIYKQFFDDIKTGPIPREKVITIETTIHYEATDDIEHEVDVEVIDYNYTSSDDFGADRTYGGERRHQGNDIMCKLQTPLVAIADGEVVKIGWDNFGGYRLSIETDSGGYLYYAHLDSYEEGIQQGDEVSAGDIIGYVGDTGYGPPVTKGKFDPHLHLQIGVKVEGEEEYMWVNPYNVVKGFDFKRITLEEQIQRKVVIKQKKK